MMRRSFGASAEEGITLVVADRFFDALALIVLLLGCGLLLAHDLVVSATLFLVISAIALGLGHLSLAHRMLDFLAAHLPRVAGALASAMRVVSHLEAVGEPRRILAYTALSIFGWILESTAMFVILRDLGTNLRMDEATFAFISATLGGAVFLLPGGLGGFEGTMVAILLGMGTSSTLALAATLVIRLTTLWFGVLTGLLVFSIWLLSSRPSNLRGGSAF